MTLSSGVAAVLGEGVADFRHGTGEVVGHAIDDDGRAADTVAFVADFLVGVAVGTAGATLDGALDVVLGHVGVGRLVPGHAQARVAVRVGAAGARRQRLARGRGRHLRAAGAGDGRGDCLDPGPGVLPGLA
ncbi:hypothetical protein G6F59_016423 [Rhizopus arrhizus]|nr:hypothetical protein G6F59_016423 [Rhizopus arrhizus]